MTNITFERHKEKLQECLNHGDTEAAHIMADSVLCMIAKDAAKTLLNFAETNILVGMYLAVEKWYA